MKRYITQSNIYQIIIKEFMTYYGMKYELL